MAKAKKTRLRLRNNSLIIILVLILGFFVYEANTYNSGATGFYVLNPAANPTAVFTFERQADMFQISANEWRPHQKYTVDEHRYCIADCFDFAKANDYEVIDAHSVKWGECRCEVAL
jgi:hypothetical protein|tara:strand:- start:263 stop:613 length:351 start_codon:yes stop_codon:yes gene_type:complete